MIEGPSLDGRVMSRTALVGIIHDHLWILFNVISHLIH